MYRVVIPARFGSTRLPGKALIEVAGRTVLEWVYGRARASRAGEVVIATDDERIAAAARGFRAEVEMTSASHPSGMDRIAEVARARGWKGQDIIVNLQGDEPLMPPSLIDQVAELLESDKHADIATLCAPIDAATELSDPNVVKVVCDRAGHALYFSRAPIPWNRDDPRTTRDANRHIGIYAYRVSALQRMTELPASRLERLEQLEQLRALENGLVIRVAAARERPGADVNTREDLERVARELRG
ncbi:MAG TPA: 3-deoxy-manno-octulosonate cytidylyltransferase [Steroidobacteraceae bacterium]|nr:3-deoxy-manno-octulosonate cytidylyltransferase [Steroidobacteraceae bacterium]